MKIQITKCSVPGAWYESRVGETFEVDAAHPDHGLTVFKRGGKGPFHLHIPIGDASAVGPKPTAEDYLLMSRVNRQLGTTIALLAFCQAEPDTHPDEVSLLEVMVQKQFTLSVAMARLIRRSPTPEPSVFPAATSVPPSERAAA